MRFIYPIIIALLILSCKDNSENSKKSQAVLASPVEFDTIDCCRPNMMGCTPCGRIIIFKKPVSNELFCNFLNQKNDKTTTNQIQFINGKYSVKPGFENLPFRFKSIKLLKEFTSWYNVQIKDYHRKDSTEKYRYSDFKIPNGETLEEFGNYGNLEINKMTDPILIESSENKHKGSYLYLTKSGWHKESSSGVEF